MTSEQYIVTRGRSLGWLGMMSGIVASGAMILTASQASFTGSTSGDSNRLATGTVELVDQLNDAAAMFQVDNMRPGQSDTRCIEVEYTGSIPDPGPVRFYSGGVTDSGLGPHLGITVEEGTGSDSADCSGFQVESEIVSDTLSAFNTNHTGYANGAGVWDPSMTPESRSYRITVELDAGAPNDVQGKSVTGQVFRWEVQS
jgi:hypothetical protein